VTDQHDSGEQPTATQVDALLREERAKRVAVRIALGAMVLSLVSSGLVWVHSARVAREARVEAVQEANRARDESGAGLCELVAYLLDADRNTNAPPSEYRIELRRRLEAAYTTPGCHPPLTERTPVPIPSRSAPPR
jgi:hypothetical protein